MLTQETVVFAVVAAAVAGFAWRWARRRKARGGTCCGCSSSGGSGAPRGLVLKARKNEPVQIGFK